MPKKKTAATKQKKLPHIKPINNFALLMVLSVFQLLSGTAAAGGTGTFEVKVLLCTLALIVLEWLYVSVFYFAMHRRNFELEFIAFFVWRTARWSAFARTGLWTALHWLKNWSPMTE